MILSVEDRITRATIALMQDKRTLAYSGLLMVGKVEVSDDCPTAMTNGRDVTYGRAFVEGLTDAELRFVLLHETKHKMYQHLFVWRKLYDEDAQLANQACDYVINLEIYDLDKRGGFITMPKGGLVNEQYRGLDSSEVFAKLKDDKANGGSAAGDALDEHDWEGAQTLSDSDKEELTKELTSAIRTGALLAGKQGGDVDRSFEATMQSTVDWTEQLREFVSATVTGRGDSTWARPNRRWLQQDMYMPSQVSESIGNICVAIDTSGSTTAELIGKSLSELVSICENSQPDRVDLLYWDTAVAGHELYTEADYQGMITSTRPKGGGGTDVNAVFDYIDENKLEPECLIVITDGYTPYPQHPSSYPVIWAMIDNRHTVPPFGAVIRVN